MSEPAQRRGYSRQDYGTPWPLIRAVESRFGSLHVDLAARADNAKAPIFVTPEIDSLSVDWDQWADRRCWLNPEFDTIPTWANHCRSHSAYFTKSGGLIIMLTPASVGTNWFADHVHQKALVLALNPRLTFEGAADAYPKDLMLSIFGTPPGFDVWRWK